MEPTNPTSRAGQTTAAFLARPDTPTTTQEGAGEGREGDLEIKRRTPPSLSLFLQNRIETRPTRSQQFRSVRGGRRGHAGVADKHRDRNVQICWVEGVAQQ